MNQRNFNTQQPYVRRSQSSIVNFLLLIVLFFVVSTCTKKETTEKETGYLTLNVSQATNQKSGIEIIDFTLRINDGHTDLIKERIGDLPSQITLPVGTYTVEAYSLEFFEPKFELPFYSGKATVEIEAGETKMASLKCSQANAGVQVVWSSDFSVMYNTFQAQIDCDQGYLHYSPDESRTGYFLPGTVSISILADGKIINSGTVTLFARDMVTVNLRTKESATGKLTIDITVDETINNRNVDVIVDPDDTRGSVKNPYNIEEAIAKQGENGVWIMGYIVGATNAQNFVNGTKQTTMVVLADHVDETNYTKTVLVQLPAGVLRNAINIVDNPENLHKKVAIRGNLGTYSSRPGLVGITDYYFK